MAHSEGDGLRDLAVYAGVQDAWPLKARVLRVIGRTGSGDLAEWRALLWPRRPAHRVTEVERKLTAIALAFPRMVDARVRSTGVGRNLESLGPVSKDEYQHMARTGRVSRPFEAVANLDEWLAAEDVDRLAGVGYERLWAVLRKKRPRTAFRHLGRTVLEASPPPTRRRRVVRGPNRVAWLREAALSLQASTWAVEMAGQWVGRLGADTAEGELDQAARQLSLAAHSGAIDPEEAKALQRQATAALARVLEREAELGRLLVEGRRALRPLASDAAAARTDPGWWLRSEQVDRVLTDIDQFQTFASAVEGARPDLLATGVSPAEVRQVASDARARQDFLRRIRAIQTLILVLSLRMDHALPEVVRQTVADLLAGEGDAAEATRVARGVARLVPQILALVEQERGAAFFPVSAPSASAYVGLSQASGARTAYRGARIAPERMPGPPSAVATRAGADGD